MKTILLILLLLILPDLIDAKDSKSFSMGGLAVVGAEFINVGGKIILDPDCDFATIQSAIDSGANPIHIVTGTYNTNLVIDERSVQLLGGYSTCNAAQNTSNFNANEIPTINAGSGNFALPGITITGNDSRYDVALRNLKIQGGEGSGFLAGGGISVILANVSLNLKNVDLFNNEGILGGGLSIIGGDVDVLADNLLVRNNIAQQGGGIYCAGNGTNITITDTNIAMRSGIFDNQTSAGNGGGVLLQNGCDLRTYSGTRLNDFSDLRGIYSNVAVNGNGGGIAVESGSKLFLEGIEVCNGSCIGNDENPININDNQALTVDGSMGLGGGLYVTGTGSKVAAINMKLANNLSTEGGGAYIGPDATFIIRKSRLPCWQAGLCNQIDANRAARFGGGILVEATSDTDITHTQFSNNRANSGTAAFFRSSALPSTPTVIKSSIFSGNGDNGNGEYRDSNVIHALADVDFLFTTVADNQVLDEIFFKASESTLNLEASVVHNPGIDVFGFFFFNTGFIANCLVTNEDTSFNGNNIIVANPDFIDRVNGNYRITASSPAIDMCTGQSALDIDDQQRGFDDPTVINIDGPYDAGVDEFWGNDIIFIDGFQ